jgi:hypothetical protein
MKEMHAYRNDDGTYRIEAIGEIHDGYKLSEVTIKAARARIDMEILADLSPDKTLYTIDVKENDDGDN